MHIKRRLSRQPGNQTIGNSVSQVLQPDDVRQGIAGAESIRFWVLM